MSYIGKDVESKSFNVVNVGTFELSSTDAGGDASPTITLDRNSASPADDDFIGNVLFKGRNSANEIVSYASFQGKIDDASDGTEDGRLIFKAMKAGSLTTVLDVRPDSFKINNVGSVVFGDPVDRFVFEGSTGDAFETTLLIAEPEDSDKTITLPNATGTIVLQDSSGHINLGSNERLKANSGALQLYHNGTHGLLDNYTGDLYIRDSGGDIYIQAKAGENSAAFYDDGAVELYHDNNLRLTTTSDGVKVTGGAGDATLTLEADTDNSDEFDNPALVLSQDGGGSVSKLRLNSGNDTIIEAHNNGDLHLQDSSNRDYFKGSPAGAVELYYNNSKKFETTSSGVDITGTITAITSDNNPQLIVKSTDDDSSSGPEIELFRDSASPADNDALGQIQFKGRNDAAQELTYAEIDSFIRDASDGTEDAEIRLSVRRNGTLSEAMMINEGIVTFNEGGNDVDFRIEADNESNAFFLNGGSGFIGINEGSPQAQMHITTSDFKALQLEGPRPTMFLKETDGSANENYQIRVDGGDLLFQQQNDAQSSAADVLRCNANKNIMIGTSGNQLSGSTSLTVNNHATGRALDVKRNTSTSSNHIANFYSNVGGTSTIQAVIEASGDVESRTNNFTGTSDETLKENIVDANNQWNDIKALQVKNYNFIGEPERTCLGVIAQEVEAAGMNGLVKTSSETGKMSVKYSVLYMKAVKALQEAMIRIETLEAKVAALEAADITE
jgi:hypothetical protein